MNGVQEASSSNLDTRTKKVPLSYESGTFSIAFKAQKLGDFWAVFLCGTACGMMMKFSASTNPKC